MIILLASPGYFVILILLVMHAKRKEMIESKNKVHQSLGANVCISFSHMPFVLISLFNKMVSSDAHNTSIACTNVHICTGMNKKNMNKCYENPNLCTDCLISSKQLKTIKVAA